MLKVLLVDDEPFILQGIKVIIDWEKEGFEITLLDVPENGVVNVTVWKHWNI